MPRSERRSYGVLSKMVIHLYVRSIDHELCFQHKIMYIMIRILKLIFPISHLSYAPNTIPLLQKFQSPPHDPLPFPLLALHFPAHSPPLLSRLFKTKPHAQLLELYLRFIEKGEEKPKDIAYQSIEQNLRRKVIQELKEKQMKVTLEKLNVLQSQLIEEKEFRGVFIHRKLNLNSSSYQIKPHQKGSATFELKKSLRSEAVKEYERIIKIYSKQKMEDIYCRSYDEFQKESQVTRRIYRMIADITLTINQEGKKYKIGGEPTEHILQVQSVFNRSYRQQEFFLTDIDFLLKGNYFLRERLN